MLTSPAKCVTLPSSSLRAFMIMSISSDLSPLPCTLPCPLIDNLDYYYTLPIMLATSLMGVSLSLTGLPLLPFVILEESITDLLPCLIFLLPLSSIFCASFIYLKLAPIDELSNCYSIFVKPFKRSSLSFLAALFYWRGDWDSFMLSSISSS